MKEIRANVQHPRQGAVEFSVNVGDVVQNDGFVQQHLVEGKRESSVQMVAVKHGQTHHPSDKVKVRQVLLSHPKRSL